MINTNGKYPLWVIIEFFSMGMLSRFFKDMYNEDKNIIANLYSTTGACLENWIQCVTTIRNRCAIIPGFMIGSLRIIRFLPRSFAKGEYQGLGTFACAEKYVS